MKLLIFLKNCYFFKSAILSQNKLVRSFEIHNLEGNQIYYKNISLHLAYLKTNEKKIIFVKKNLQNCYFFF